MQYNRQYVKNSVDNIKEYAKSMGFKVVFRNVTTNAGDFCFFIYRTGYRRYHTKYLIGFDGYWNADRSTSTSFDRCRDAVHAYISNYNKN